MEESVSSNSIVLNEAGACLRGRTGQPPPQAVSYTHLDVYKRQTGMSSRPIYYLPISDTDVLLEGCETLLKTLVESIIERHINGCSNYTVDDNVVRVQITKLEIEYYN